MSPALMRMASLEAIAFLDPDNERTILTASMVNPLYRLALLRSSAVRLGTCKYALRSTATLCVTVVRDASDSSPPPLLSVPFVDPQIHMEASHVSVPSFVHTVSAVGKARQFCCVEVELADEPCDADQRELSRCLGSVVQRTERLKVSLLRYCGGWPCRASRLSHLELQRYVGDEGELLDFVQNCDLISLSIYDTQVFGEKAARGGWIPITVEELHVDGSNCTEDCFGSMPSAPILRRLSLDNCTAVDSLDVTCMTQLRSLSAARTNLDCNTLTGLARCTHLGHLNLSGCRRLRDVNLLASLKALRELFIHETAVTDAGIEGLRGCLALEKLNLGGCVLISNVNCLCTLRNLKELHLWMTRVRTEGIAGLSGCYSLVEVVFDGCSRLSSVNALRGLPSLRFVSLSQTSVDEAGIKGLQDCPSLETLDVRGTLVNKPPKLFMRKSVEAFFDQLQ